MNIGVIGLGRMGKAIVARLQAAQHTVVGYDPDEQARSAITCLGASSVASLQELTQAVTTFWLMVPAGDPTDTVINELKQYLKPGAIIIDGGNSFFEHSVRRHNDLAKQSIYFLDCGTSGGLAGETIGYSLMIGGKETVYEEVKPLFEAIAAPNGYAYMGPPGSGHYVKMVHNGIEYALLQSYAEGLHLLKEGQYSNLDLAAITNVWQHGSVIRSWILDLAHDILAKDQNLDTVSGEIGENLTGRWTLEEAQKQGVPINLIEESLAIRALSRKTGGNYGTKVVAMLRKAFGGHPVKSTHKE